MGSWYGSTRRIEINLNPVYAGARRYSYASDSAALWRVLLEICLHEFGHVATEPLLDPAIERCYHADYRAYADAQARVDQAYRDSALWTKMTILNTARMGKFSSDRSISEYAAKIWRLSGVSVGSQ